MGHDVSLITTLVAGLGLALVMGFIATRIKLPALVGYLVAAQYRGFATPTVRPARAGRPSGTARVSHAYLAAGVGLTL